MSHVIYRGIFAVLKLHEKSTDRSSSLIMSGLHREGMSCRNVVILLFAVLQPYRDRSPPLEAASEAASEANVCLRPVRRAFVMFHSSHMKISSDFIDFPRSTHFQFAIRHRMHRNLLLYNFCDRQITIDCRFLDRGRPK